MYRSDFARILHERGVETVTRSVTAFLTEAAMAKIIAGRDAPLIADVFFGALIGPMQMNLLLGLTQTPDEAEIAARSQRTCEAVRRICASHEQRGDKV